MSVDLVVVGLGYAGLPLLARAVDSGLSAVGFDISPEVVSGLNAGRSHVTDVPDSAVADMLAAGFRATTDPAVIAEAETVVLCVPTGLSADGAPDLSAVRRVPTPRESGFAGTCSWRWSPPRIRARPRRWCSRSWRTPAG